MFYNLDGTGDNLLIMDQLAAQRAHCPFKGRVFEDSITALRTYVELHLLSFAVNRPPGPPAKQAKTNYDQSKQD